MSYYDHKIAITLTVQELTDLDEVLSQWIQGFDPEMYESDSALEEGHEDLARYTALQEKIQYHLS